MLIMFLTTQNMPTIQSGTFRTSKKSPAAEGLLMDFSDKTHFSNLNGSVLNVMMALDCQKMVLNAFLALNRA